MAKVYVIMVKVYITMAKVYVIMVKVYITMAKVYVIMVKVYITMAKVYVIMVEVYITMAKVFAIMVKVYITMAKVYAIMVKAYTYHNGKGLCLNGKSLYHNVIIAMLHDNGIIYIVYIKAYILIMMTTILCISHAMETSHN